MYSKLQPERGAGSKLKSQNSESYKNNNGIRELMKFYLGGGGGIRTHGTLSRSTVFKTVAIDHSATPPAGSP